MQPVAGHGPSSGGSLSCRAAEAGTGESGPGPVARVHGETRPPRSSPWLPVGHGHPSCPTSRRFPPPRPPGWRPRSLRSPSQPRSRQRAGIRPAIRSSPCCSRSSGTCSRCRSARSPCRTHRTPAHPPDIRSTPPTASTTGSKRSPNSRPHRRSASRTS